MQAADTIIIKVEKSKKEAFLEMRKWLDFVEVQSPDSVLQRFLKTAPTDVSLDYDDVVAEVMAHRYGEK
jgi:hypothetical protein